MITKKERQIASEKSAQQLSKIKKHKRWDKSKVKEVKNEPLKNKEKEIVLGKNLIQKGK